jgi:hypothetical protein
MRRWDRARVGRAGRWLAVLVLAVATGAGPRPARAQAGAAPRTWNTRLVGHLDPGGGPFGDVWAHRDVAYLGSYRRADCRPPPAVRAIDLRDPARPRPLASFGAFPGSDGQDLWVGAVRTRAFRGDLAVVGVQPCDRRRPGFAGLATYDLTDPARPRRLGQLATGTSSGVHELGVVQRPDGRVLALAAVPFSFPESSGRRGDLRIVDVTDPRRPREVADWDVRRDGPAAVRAQLGARRDVYCHSAWPFAEGRKLFASFWSAGAQFLDISDPARPRWVGQTGYPDSDRYRAAHSGWFGAGERLFVQNDETLRPDGTGDQATWTVQRVYDTTHLDRPVQVATFAPEEAVPGRDGRIARDGVYSVHNAVVDGDLEYVSWYAAGVRVVDLADPRRPREVAWFVPPGTPGAAGVGPVGGGRAPLVWGVYPYRGVVLASDMRSGLWVFRVGRPGAGSSTPAPAGPAADRRPAATLPVVAAAAVLAVVVAAAIAGRRARRRSG